MKLKLERYEVTAETLVKVIEALGEHWFSNGGYTNNDEVIAAQKELEAELNLQENPPREEEDEGFDPKEDQASQGDNDRMEHLAHRKDSPC